MRFYTIQNENVLIADTQQALTKYYDYVFELPEDYEKGKYIIGEKEEEIEVPDYDEDGNPIIIEYEETEIVIDYDEDGAIIGTHEIVVTKHKQSTHTETIKVKVLVLNPDWEEEASEFLRAKLNEENTTKAKEAVEQGYVEFKEAQFETNAQTVGDLTATMLLMQASGLETYQWLSKDDKVVELSLEDFGTLGGLIAGFKAHIWSEEYLTYKQQIAQAQTYEDLKEIVIEY